MTVGALPYREDKNTWFGETQHGKIGFFRSEYVEEVLDETVDGKFNHVTILALTCRKFVRKGRKKEKNAEITRLWITGSVIPPEIQARGPRAERAFQKALRNGRVQVFRGRIMILGQDRAGKTSLKKSLLGMPFNPEEESTVGVEVDPSKFEVEVDQVKNWQRTDQTKLDVSQFVEDIARIVAKDLKETEVDQKNTEDVYSLLEQVILKFSGRSLSPFALLKAIVFLPLILLVVFKLLPLIVVTPSHDHLPCHLGPLSL